VAGWVSKCLDLIEAYSQKGNGLFVFAGDGLWLRATPCCMRSALCLLTDTDNAAGTRSRYDTEIKEKEMPPGYVTTIREEILYEYAKLISRSAYKSLQRGFITDRFKKLRDGEITISGEIREWEREQELPKQCVFCGSTKNLSTDHLVPRSRGGDDSADNLVLACQSCNAARGEKGVFEWLGLKQKDKLHRLVAGKYLKQLLTLHEQAGTLEIAKDQITILCAKCALPKVCENWGKVRELTCFCLESILPYPS
jgi:hypothetical protein